MNDEFGSFVNELNNLLSEHGKHLEGVREAAGFELNGRRFSYLYQNNYLSIYFLKPDDVLTERYQLNDADWVIENKNDILIDQDSQKSMTGKTLAQSCLNELERRI